MAQNSSSRASNIRGVLRQAGEPIFLLSPQGRFLFVNKSWEELTGRTMEEVAGVVCGARIVRRRRSRRSRGRFSPAAGSARRPVCAA